MYWTPLQPRDIELIAAWFEDKQNFKLPTNKNMKSFFKNLFFDKSIIRTAQAQHISINRLKNFLEQGKISLQEYLYLSR